MGHLQARCKQRPNMHLNIAAYPTGVRVLRIQPLCKAPKLWMILRNAMESAMWRQRGHRPPAIPAKHQIQE